MRRKDFARIVGNVFFVAFAASVGWGYDRAGWEAQLSTFSHDVAGTVRIVDEDTLEIEGFTYDGDGPGVYFYLGEDNSAASFGAGLGVGPLLTGTVYNDDMLTVDLPEGVTLDGYNAVSVWCVDFSVNFGSGEFGSVVQYEVTFDAVWSEATHEHLPLYPHFSGMVGATHNEAVTFWQLGGSASAGVEAMAEMGSKSLLKSEVDSAILSGGAYGYLSGSPIIPSPNSVSLTFEMNSSHPLVTLVSMIAPSPDWFVGVKGLELYEAGRWKGEVVVDLFPYDAGTDSGEDFNSPNDDTQPREPISLITEYPFEGEPALGTFTFKLMCDNPPLGDLNLDCRVDFFDFALMASNWLVDCNTNPNSPECL
jgi:hypothetical protein